MSQPVAGDSWTAVGTVGTVVVTNRTTVLRSVIIPGTYIGTVNFHDAAAATGTSATSQIISIGLPATSTPTTIRIDAQCKTGLVYQASGTPALTFTWS